jgi:acetoin utilization deacetylase AcuC-like enzyme
MENLCQNAYCLVRPPGHHSTKNQGMGFCIFNNIALTAFHLQKKWGLKRIAIIDYDVHHGNGTQVNQIKFSNKPL